MDEIWHGRSGRKKRAADYRSRIFNLTSHFQDGAHDDISHHKVMPSDE